VGEQGRGPLLIADRAPFGGPARALARAFRVTLDDNHDPRRGGDGKPDGVLTIDVSADGEKTHAIFAGVSAVVYVVGESLDGPGPILRAPKGTYSGPNQPGGRRPLGRGQADRPRLLPRLGPCRRHRRRRHASAFGSRGGATHRGISEADNALFVRNTVRWLAGNL